MYVQNIFIFQKLLPLRTFHYGPMINKDQYAAVKIGPLICKGLEHAKPKPMFSVFQNSGHTWSGSFLEFNKNLVNEGNFLNYYSYNKDEFIAPIGKSCTMKVLSSTSRGHL